jgi:hypothetical protein
MVFAACGNEASVSWVCRRSKAFAGAAQEEDRQPVRNLANAVVAATAALPFPAFAQPIAVALLTEISGGVLVDSGEGFMPVSGDVRLKLGDRVLVTKEGEAVLSYGGNCSFPLQAPSMTTIEPTACSATTQGTSGEGGAPATGLSVVGPPALTAAALANDEETPASP